MKNIGVKARTCMRHDEDSPRRRPSRVQSWGCVIAAAEGADMRFRILVTVLLAPILAVALGATASSADPVSSGLGLWSNGYAPATAPTDCNRFFSDSNNFCVADDGASVELGVKFTTARATQITGVR